MAPEAPTAWSVYISTDDADALAKKVEAAGGKVLAPPFDVGDQGRMATFADPSGGGLSSSQPPAMGAAIPPRHANTFGWGQLRARRAHNGDPLYTKALSCDPKI